MSETLTISQNTHTVDDCHLASAAADVNYGKATTFSCGYVFAIDNKLRPLLRFPLTDLPADARIQTAKMTLYCTTAAASAEPAGWHALTTRDWVETQATWNIYKTGSSWTSAGGDYNPFGGPETAGTFNLPTATGDFDITLTADEIAYAIGVDNYFNVILKRVTESGASSYAAIASGEHATTAWRPRLIITYIPVGVKLQGDLVVRGDVRLL